jgi:hypothetical protein
LISCKAMRIQKWWAADAVTLLLVAPTFASPTSTSGEDVSRISEAANAWTKHGTCSGKLFERTPANIRSSNYLELYNEAISKLKVEFPEEYRNSGEASLFAQKIANAHGFTCTSQTPGCDEIPSCQSVALYVQQQNYTAEETVDRTSKIMLAIHQINAISKYLNTLKVRKAIVLSVTKLIVCRGL